MVRSPIRPTALLTTALLTIASCSHHQSASNSLPEASGSATPPGAFALTVYSTADPATFNPQDLLQSQLSSYYNGGQTVYPPGYGVVRETRRLSLSAGVNSLEYADVAAGIDPTTVTFSSLTAPQTTSVLEQNFEFDLNSSDKLLQKYLDRTVEITMKQDEGSKSHGATIRGKLLSVSGGSYIIQTDDRSLPLAIVNAANVESIRLADANTGFVSKPTLRWKVEAQQAGQHDVQVTYQTDGLTWRSDYSLLINKDEKAADLSAWVTLLNSSGMNYPDAKLKLVAGAVQRFESPDRAQRGPVANSLFAAGGAGHDTGFKEQSFFEYHLYTLGRTTTLMNNSTKQVELFPSRSNVPMSKTYVYYGLSSAEGYSYVATPQMDRTFGTDSNKRVDIYVMFKNDLASGMGIPLPAGRVRVYKADPKDGSREFIGEDIIQHTPKGEQVMVRLGSAFDIVGERIQTNLEAKANEATESFEITLRNHKPDPVRMIVKENLYRWFNWEIIKSSDPFEKKDFRTIHIPVDVPANGEKKVTYTVRYTW